MKRTFAVTILTFLSIASLAAAKDVFPDTERKGIEVLDIHDGKATIQDRDGRKADAEVGDRIGRDAGTILEMEESAIVVKQGNARTRIPRYRGVVREMSKPM